MRGSRPRLPRRPADQEGCRSQGNTGYRTHSESGDTLYGIEIMVHPDFRGMHLARRLYDARKALCREMRAVAASVPKFIGPSTMLCPTVRRGLSER